MTVRQLAQFWNKDIDDTLYWLELWGIYAVDLDVPLSREQIIRINEGIDEINKPEEEITTSEDVEEEKEDNEKERQAIEALKYFLETYYVFIDTCSLLHPSCPTFLDRAEKILEANNKKIYIPFRVFEELDAKFKDKTNPELSKKAENIALKLSQLQKKQLIEFKGEDNDAFADSVFYTQFSKHRMDKKLLLITQDTKLTLDILNLNNIESSKGHRVSVRKITSYGYLGVPSNLPPLEVQGERASRPEIKKFNMATELTTLSSEPLNVTKIPVEKDVVFTESKSKIQLVKELGAGGEGKVYKTDTEYVAKIYSAKENSELRREKIRRMVSTPVECEGICWPKEMLFNEHNEFVGYLMPMAKGITLDDILAPQKLLDTFPQWTKRELIELAISIVRKIVFLNNRNIILGDINPNNFLVVDSKEVYLVDVDSYQIEEFPCPVGTTEYVAPEIQGQNFRTFLRTFEHENFSVATLIFMIMELGKKPYDKLDGEDIVGNILNMDFSYPLGQDTNKMTPNGPWRYIWSHLSRAMKNALYETFRKGEAHNAPENRYSSQEWLRILKRYYNQLDKLIENDEMSGDILPTRFKKNPNVNYITCKLCQKEVEESWTTEGICGDCLSDGEEYECIECGEIDIYTNHAKYINKEEKRELCPQCYHKPYQITTCTMCHNEFTITRGQALVAQRTNKPMLDHCKSCREKAKQIAETNKCVTCGEEFGITYGELDHIKKMDGNKPIRCRKCRKKVREIAEVRKCITCGEDINITYGQLERINQNGGKKPIRCHTCRKKAKEVYETRRCKVCNNEFTITYGQYESYTQNGQKLPCRCRTCIQENRRTEPATNQRVHKPENNTRVQSSQNATSESGIKGLKDLFSLWF